MQLQFLFVVVYQSWMKVWLRPSTILLSMRQVRVGKHHDCPIDFSVKLHYFNLTHYSIIHYSCWLLPNMCELSCLSASILGDPSEYWVSLSTGFLPLVNFTNGVKAHLSLPWSLRDIIAWWQDESRKFHSTFGHNLVNYQSTISPFAGYP